MFLVVRGCWLGFFGVIVVTQSCGGLCMISLAANHALFG